jgi:hypothetical protein
MNEIIKRIELDIDGVGITLTPEQARKLHAALAELLGVKAEKEYVPMPYQIAPYTPPQPLMPTPFSPYTITCGTQTWNDVGTAHIQIN